MLPPASMTANLGRFKRKPVQGARPAKRPAPPRERRVGLATN
jgi:hypothetical protein